MVNEKLKAGAQGLHSYSMLCIPEVRGQIMSFSANLNKTCNFKLQELSTSISKLEEIANCFSPSLLKRRVDLQTEFDLITITDAECLLLRSRSMYYEYSDKASRRLAHQLHHQAASRMITQIKDFSGTLNMDPTTLNSVFHSFYSSYI